MEDLQRRCGHFNIDAGSREFSQEKTMRLMLQRRNAWPRGLEKLYDQLSLASTSVQIVRNSSPVELLPINKRDKTLENCGGVGSCLFDVSFAADASIQSGLCVSPFDRVSRRLLMREC